MVIDNRRDGENPQAMKRNRMHIMNRVGVFIEFRETELSNCMEANRNENTFDFIQSSFWGSLTVFLHW